MGWAAEQKLVQGWSGPPSRLRRFGAASFAGWLARAEAHGVGLSSRERRMVDQTELNRPHWSRIIRENSLTVEENRLADWSSEIVPQIVP